MNTRPVSPGLGNATLRLFAMVALCLFAGNSFGQYLGVTCGWQYSAQLSGPLTYPNQYNISLYNPDPANPNMTWDSWAEQLAQAGVDYVSPNLTGSQPNTSGSPTNMLPLLTAIINRGLTNRIKFAIFDDNAASWVAQWNEANGRGYGYADKFDMSDTNNWKYIYDYNYRLFYQTIPDANRFKINGRPLIVIWTGNTVTFLTNMQGNASQAMMYVRQKCQADFGFNPFIVLSSDFFQNDTTCNNPGVADGSESWFVGVPDSNYTNSHSLTTKNGTTFGVAVAEFQHTGQSGFLDPNHGVRFDVGLSNTVEANARITLCEGFTDYEEDAAMWRVRDLDSSGNSFSYAQTLYDFPNQRINLLRKHSNWPFPPELKFEAEGCDYYGGANGGNGKTNYYRNGNIAIEPTSDVGGGHDVGWIEPGEWLEWEQVPIQGSQVHLQARVATPNNGCQLHFVIDGTNFPAMSIPNTANYQTWETIDSGPFSFSKGSLHTVRIVCDTGGFNLNYWQYHDIIPIGANVNLLAKANNKWVSSAATTLNANVTSNPGLTEQFTVVDASSGYGYGYVALEAMGNNSFVTADTNGINPLAANATSVDKPQIFEWTDNADGTITLRSLANSDLVTATNNPSTIPLVANSIRTVGNNQLFTLGLVSSNTLSFTASPNSVSIGTPITAGNLGEVQVLALDGNNNAVSKVVVTVAIASGTGSVTDNTAVTDANGIAHFTNMTIDKVGPKILQASSSAFVPTLSSQVTITAGAASGLTVETTADGSGVSVPAETVTANTSIKVYAILRDSGGNFISNAPAVWSLINLTGGVAGADLVASPDGLSATFTGHLVGTAKIQAAGEFTGISGLQTVVDSPVAFSSGTFTDDSVLNLVGLASQELYGASLGDSTARTTANGYTFSSYPTTNISYGGSGAYSPGAIFLGGGGTSGDAGFDAVLNNGELGIGGGGIILSNLVPGTTYNVLFLSADTRTSVGARSFAIASGSSSSPSQYYAFTNGVPALGGFILGTFTAAGNTRSFTNTQSAYGYQLNAVLVGRVPVNTVPVIVNFAYANSTVSISGTNGMFGGTYRILASTNLTLPLAYWTPILTNAYSALGTFNSSWNVDPSAPAAFYRIISP